MAAARWARTLALGAVLLRQRAVGLDTDDADIEERVLSPGQLQALHKLMDKDGDGKISLPEVMNFSHAFNRDIATRDIGAILEEMDTSKDGKLSLDEHLTDIHNQAEGNDEEMKELGHRTQVEAAKFSAADLDSDGLLDMNELPSLFYPELHPGVLEITAQETMRQKDRDGDGKLSPDEFWEADEVAGEDEPLSTEELDDFLKLDLNGDGSLDVQELKAWESGTFLTEEAMRHMIEIADKDSDMHVSAAELASAKEDLATSDAHFHLIEWAELHEL